MQQQQWIGTTTNNAGAETKGDIYSGCEVGKNKATGVRTRKGSCNPRVAPKYG